MKLKSILLFITLSLLVSFVNFSNKIPKGFIDVSTLIPNLKIELRYATSHNFIGKIIDGYQSERCILTTEAALALQKIEEELVKQDMCLVIYDAYRPQKAVNHFVKWAKNTTDTVMKSEFYPNVKKKDLFRNGYISSKSRHSSGSTIDLSIFSDKTNDILDMGSDYDYFGKESWVNFNKLTKEQQKNRQILQSVMLKNGFRNYPKEWWHFTLRYEPYRNQYFDFDIN